MAVTIKLLEGETGDGPKTLSIQKTTILVGRGNDQDVKLTNDSVSRRHCVIEKREGQWRIIDEDSENGVWVNGQRVQKSRVLKHEDVIETGEVMFRIGLERPIKETKGTGPSIPGLVKAISAVVVLLVFGLAGTAMYMLMGYKQAMSELTATLPVKLAAAEKRKVFTKSADEVELTYRVIDNLPRWISDKPRYFDSPSPEWNLKDIWSTQNIGSEPRLFEGLDLDLPGGIQAVSSGYFLIKRAYTARDVNDPVGVLNIEIEGWGGLGDKFANAESVPAVRAPELPRYVRSIEINPTDVKNVSHAGSTGVQTARFQETRNFSPPDPLSLANAAIVPTFSENLINLFPKAQSRDTLVQGRYTSFFKDGNRYALTVRGTANLLDRFQGGLDGVSQALLDSMQMTAPVRPPLPAKADLEAQIKAKTIMLIGASRKPVVVDAIFFPDLKETRDLLLTLQRIPETLNGETELRRMYFVIRNRAQNELDVSAARIWSGRSQTASREGERELIRLREFLKGYPPVTLERGDPGYPEWAMYYEDVTDRNPYQKLKIPKTR